MAYGVGSCKNRSDSDQNRPGKLGNLTVILASKRSIIHDLLCFGDVDINDVMSIDQYRTLPHGLAKNHSSVASTISIYHLIFYFLSFFKYHPHKNQPENRLIAMVA